MTVKFPNFSAAAALYKTSMHYRAFATRLSTVDIAPQARDSFCERTCANNFKQCLTESDQMRASCGEQHNRCFAKAIEENDEYLACVDDCKNSCVDSALDCDDQCLNAGIACTSACDNHFPCILRCYATSDACYATCHETEKKCIAECADPEVKCSEEFEESKPKADECKANRSECDQTAGVFAKACEETFKQCNDSCPPDGPSETEPDGETEPECRKERIQTIAGVPIYKRQTESRILPIRKAFFFKTGIVTDGEVSFAPEYNCNEVPCLALPPELMSPLGVGLGDLAVVAHGPSEKFTFAIVAGTAQEGRLGLASSPIAEIIPIGGNTMTFLVFPGSGDATPRSIPFIRGLGADLFGRWGWMRAVRACSSQVAITDGAGKLLTGTQKVRVGELVDLAVQIADGGAGRALSGVTWVVPGNRIKDYHIYGDSAWVDKLQQNDLEKANIKFYWIKPGTHPVGVTAQIDGKPHSARVTFEVAAPVFVSFTSRTGSVSVGPYPFEPLKGVNSLMFAKMTTDKQVGIEWTASVKTLNKTGGDFGIFQLVKTTRTKIDTTGNKATISSDSDYVLDDRPGAIGGVLYDYWTALDQNNTTKSFVDTPALRLDTPQLAVASVDEKFRTFLMYNPATPNSIWVPIGCLEWFWKGKATLNSGGWQPPTSASNSNYPAGKASSLVPEWPKRVSKLSWVDMP